MTRSLFFIPLAFVAAYAGCSSEDTTTKAPVSSDAGASGSDAGSTATDSGSSTTTDSGSTVTDSGSTATDAGSSNAAACKAYCDCMASTCASKAPANCQATCEAATTWDLSCRTTHCGLAGSDPTTHCPHAAGEAVCK